jgi:hypothetical protein
VTEELEGGMAAQAIAIAREAREDARMARSVAQSALMVANMVAIDVASIRDGQRAHTKALNALRETQMEQGQRLDRVEGRLDRVEVRLDRVEVRLDRLEKKVDEGFSMVSVGMAEIVALIKNVERGG